MNLSAIAFTIILLMASIETDYYSFYIVCLLVSGILVAIENNKNREL